MGEHMSEDTIYAKIAVNMLGFLICAAVLAYVIRLTRKELASYAELPSSVPEATYNFVLSTQEESVCMQRELHATTIFDMIDKDQNRRLSKDEMLVGAKLPEVQAFVANLADPVLNDMFGNEALMERSLARLDADANGQISADEWAAHLRADKDLIVEAGVRSQLLAGRVYWATGGAPRDTSEATEQDDRARTLEMLDSTVALVTQQGTAEAKPWMHDMLFLAAHKHPVMPTFCATRYSELSRWEHFCIQVISVCNGVHQAALQSLVRWRWDVPEANMAHTFIQKVFNFVASQLLFTFLAGLPAQMLYLSVSCPVVTEKALASKQVPCCCLFWQRLFKVLLLLAA